MSSQGAEASAGVRTIAVNAIRHEDFCIQSTEPECCCGYVTRVELLETAIDAALEQARREAVEECKAAVVAVYIGARDGNISLEENAHDLGVYHAYEAIRALAPEAPK